VGLLAEAGAAQTGAVSEGIYRFTAGRRYVEMRVRFPAPYAGRPLLVYRGEDPEKAVCLVRDAGGSGCVERFVGAVALVTFEVLRVEDGKPVDASLREVVKLVEQSPGMPERPPFTTTIRLKRGAGSDIQAFGYDETPLRPEDRAAERLAAQSTWRRYRQELYLDQDRQPFAVIEWLHTIAGIRIVKASAPESW
jgi:hypothetical protein